jgi:hypothetical protein
VSSASVFRSARPKAFRATACEMHTEVGCSQAPRPCRDSDGSGTTTPLRATTRTSSDRSARFRQPTQVLTGIILSRIALRRWRCRSSDTRANIQLSSETLRLVVFIRRSLMSSQRQRATGAVEERLRKRSGASCEADGAFHSLTGEFAWHRLLALAAQTFNYLAKLDGLCCSSAVH